MSEVQGSASVVRTDGPRGNSNGGRSTSGSRKPIQPADEVGNMPRQGPEVLDALFRLGPLTREQIGGILPQPVGEKQVGRIVGELGAQRDADVAGRKSKTPSKTTAEDKTSEGTASDPDGALLGAFKHHYRYNTGAQGHCWKTIYYLTPRGLAYVARRRDLYPSVAESLYRGVMEQARIDHALLRNDYYRRLMRHIPRVSHDLEDEEGLQIEALWAEKGMRPIKLGAVENNDRRYLNPDGVFEVAGLIGEQRRPYRLKVYVESDTGSEDMDWQVSGHADKYAEHLLNVLEGGLDSADGTAAGETALPVVLFISPGPRRTRWVRSRIRENGLDEDSVFNAVRWKFKEQGSSLPDLFWFTNLKWLDQQGPAGAAYWPLSASELRPLLPVV